MTLLPGPNSVRVEMKFYRIKSYNINLSLSKRLYGFNLNDVRHCLFQFDGLRDRLHGGFADGHEAEGRSLPVVQVSIYLKIFFDHHFGSQMDLQM